MGLCVIDESNEQVMAADDKPFTILSYGNGGGSRVRIKFNILVKLKCLDQTKVKFSLH